VGGKQDWEVAKMDAVTIEAWKKKDGTALKSGYITMQAESHPIDFKTIEMLNLESCTDPKALNYKSYFIKSNKSACRYKKR
jgi:hypothetical protein